MSALGRPGGAHVSHRRDCAYPHGSKITVTAWAPSGVPVDGNRLIEGSARNGFHERVMDDIGDADRVELMQRLVALQVEHRDLDTVIQRLADSAGHDQLQVTRLKRRKLLLKDQIAWLERQIDPDVLA